MGSEILNGVLRVVAGSSDVKDRPTWAELCHQVAQAKLFTPEQLEQSREHIIRMFSQFRTEFKKKEIDEQAERDIANLLAEPPRLPSPDTSASNAHLTRLEHGPVSHSSLKDLGGGFHPGLDETATVSSS